ncbi:hypothetical protein C8F01DRAFT_1170924 [Mycena amicta]|nr:hypothetical protein C8F01DRAFT_1170924 [Mycena amicta]
MRCTGRLCRQQYMCVVSLSRSESLVNDAARRRHCRRSSSSLLSACSPSTRLHFALPLVLTLPFQCRRPSTIAGRGFCLPGCGTTEAPVAEEVLIAMASIGGGGRVRQQRRQGMKTVLWASERGRVWMQRALLRTLRYFSPLIVPSYSYPSTLYLSLLPLSRVFFSLISSFPVAHWHSD